MNLKVRLALLFSLSVFIILMASAISVYLLNENFIKEEFIKRLTTEAKESGQLVFSVPQLNDNVVQQLNQKALYSLPEENISIYDSAYNLLYSTPGSRIPHISPESFSIAKRTKQLAFTDGNREGVLLSIC